MADLVSYCTFDLRPCVMGKPCRHGMLHGELTNKVTFISEGWGWALEKIAPENVEQVGYNPTTWKFCKPLICWDLVGSWKLEGMDCGEIGRIMENSIYTWP